MRVQYLEHSTKSCWVSITNQLEGRAQFKGDILLLKKQLDLNILIILTTLALHIKSKNALCYKFFIVTVDLVRPSE